MKKLLILILTILFLNILVVYAQDIDIGSQSFDNEKSIANPRTAINANNPANASGTITEVKILSYNNMTDVIVFTCYLVSGTTFTSRDYEYIGNVTGGTTQTFQVEINVEQNDYIGISYKSGNMTTRETGTGNYYSASGVYVDLPFSNYTFGSLAADRNLNLGGTGYIPVGIKWNTVTINKFNTIEIGKWNTME